MGEEPLTSWDGAKPDNIEEIRVIENTNYYILSAYDQLGYMTHRWAFTKMDKDG